MRKDNDEIRISSLSGPSATWLCLHGTILTYREKYWSRESIIDIPVELISFSEGKSFAGSRLIAALLSLLFLPGIGGAAIGLWYLFTGSTPEKVISICMGTCAVVEFFVFPFLLIRLFIRQKTVTIHIAPDDMTISFWMEKKQEPVLRHFINDVSSRKSIVTETIAHPMHFAVGDTIEKPWKRTAALTFLLIIPALITEIPWLLFAGLIPIGMHIYSTFMGAKEPKEFRLAIRHFLNREWQQARDVVHVLIRRNPEYRPAKLLLLDLLMRMEDFNGAEALLDNIQSDLNVETLQAIQQEVIIRRRVALRKKDRPSTIGST